MKWVTFSIVWLLAAAALAQSSGQEPAPEEPEPEAGQPEQPGPTAGELNARLRSPTLTVVEARSLGRELYDMGRFVDAERAWLVAYALDPAPELYVAVASARQAAGDEAAAVTALQKYLELRPEAPDRPAIEASIAMLEKAPAKLLIRTQTPGRSILLDGQPTGRTTPVELLLPPGEHQIVVAGNGQKIGERTVTLAFGEQRELLFEAEADVLAPSPEALVPSVEGPGPDEDTALPTSVWVTSGVAGAALLTGTALGFAALRKDQAYRENPSPGIAEKGDRMALFADVSVGIAAGAAVTALVLYLTGRQERDRDSGQVAFEARADRRGAVVQTSWEF